MEYQTKSHRHAEIILEQEGYRPYWIEVQKVIEGISEQDIIQYFENYESRNSKSISQTLNRLLKERFTALDWKAESLIFSDINYSQNSWRLDFAKGPISIEVSFNHAEAIAWNLVKPVIASELNHVQKAIQTEIGIMILATEKLRIAGGFDNVVGTYEKAKRYLQPLNDLLTTPVLLIGLEPPKTFFIEHNKFNNKTIGSIRYFN